jgi:hypothetical protein
MQDNIHGHELGKMLLVSGQVASIECSSGQQAVQWPGFCIASPGPKTVEQANGALAICLESGEG